MKADHRTHTMRVESVPSGRETDYLAICSCGWEALQTHDEFKALTTRCAVLEAEMEGDLRQQRRLAAHQQQFGPRAA